MENKGQRARVAYAMIDFAEGKLSPTKWDDALRISLTAGTSVERYGRRWYMAQSVEEEGWVVGRMAFEHAADSGLWDHERNDIRELNTIGTAVQAVPFVIDKTARRVAPPSRLCPL
jgi:hypothetical protein